MKIVTFSEWLSKNHSELDNIASEFIDSVKSAAFNADSTKIQSAAREAALKSQYISPNEAITLFLTAAHSKKTIALPLVQRTLLGMTEAGTSMRVNDPTIKGSRQAYQARLGKIIAKDQQKIHELLAYFID